MLHLEYLHEMERLSKRFGVKKYPSEILEEIYKVVGGFDQAFLKNVVTHFIATKQYGPLAKDFTELAAAEKRRTRRTAYQQSEHPQTLSVFSEEERKEIFKIMTLAAEKKISREDAMKFAEALSNALISKGIKPKPWREQNANGDWIV